MEPSIMSAIAAGVAVNVVAVLWKAHVDSESASKRSAAEADRIVALINHRTTTLENAHREISSELRRLRGAMLTLRCVHGISCEEKGGNGASELGGTL